PTPSAIDPASVRMAPRSLGPLMGLRRFLAERLAGDYIRDTVELALAEATIGFAIDPDENQWRSMDTRRRDLPQITHDWALEVCNDLYLRNPLGHRITELNRDFVVGHGLTYSFHNPAVADIVNEFWLDADNRLDLRLPEFCLDFGLNGELIPEVQVTDVARIVKLGYIDPLQVKRVQTVGGNPLIRDVVWVKKKGFGQRGE